MIEVGSDLIVVLLFAVALLATMWPQSSPTQRRGVRPKRPTAPPKVPTPTPPPGGRSSDRIRFRIIRWEDGEPVFGIEVGKRLAGGFIVSESQEGADEQ